MSLLIDNTVLLLIMELDPYTVTPTSPRMSDRRLRWVLMAPQLGSAWLRFTSWNAFMYSSSENCGPFSMTPLSISCNSTCYYCTCYLCCAFQGSIKLHLIGINTSEFIPCHHMKSYNKLSVKISKPNILCGYLVVSFHFHRKCTLIRDAYFSVTTKKKPLQDHTLKENLLLLLHKSIWPCWYY